MLKEKLSGTSLETETKFLEKLRIKNVFSKTKTKPMLKIKLHVLIAYTCECILFLEKMHCSLLTNFLRFRVSNLRALVGFFQA